MDNNYSHELAAILEIFLLFASLQYLYLILGFEVDTLQAFYTFEGADFLLCDPFLAEHALILRF